LQRNALVYVRATEVGGTHPALIEAMASGGAVLANDTPENREVGGDAIRYFSLGSDETLSAMLQQSLDDPASLGAWRTRAHTRAAERYSWDQVAGAYEELIRRLACR
jgi:glycosyltransferase involved in cell wall biosynthesis